MLSVAGLNRAWDCGVTWRTVRTVEPTEDPIDLDYLRNKVLRALNGTYEDDHLQALIDAAEDAYEDFTGKALMLQTRQMILDRFPWDYIELQWPPFVNVDSFTYVDADGVTQTLDGSPAVYRIAASGQFAKARLYPPYGGVWPTTQETPDAVTVTYTAGYANADAVPAIIKAGIGLFVNEMYEQRRLSVVGTSIVEAPLKLERFWKRAY